MTLDDKYCFTSTEYKVMIAKSVDKKSNEEISQDLGIPVQRVIIMQRKVRTRRHRRHFLGYTVFETSGRVAYKRIKHWNSYCKTIPEINMYFSLDQVSVTAPEL